MHKSVFSFPVGLAHLISAGGKQESSVALSEKDLFFNCSELSLPSHYGLSWTAINSGQEDAHGLWSP